MKPLAFFDQHPIFTHREFALAHSGGGRRSSQTTNNILAQHVAGGRLLRVHRDELSRYRREGLLP